MGEAAFELHELRRLRKKMPLPIPADACRIMSEIGFATPDATNVSFSLRRRKQGVEITFCAAAGPNVRFSWNASHMLDKWPSSFAEARAWVHAYAAGYGQTVEEHVKERVKAPTGDDRKLLRSGGCREAWLRSDVPALWAEAAVRCQHSGAFCGQDGYCHLGDCDMLMDMPEPARG